MPVSPYFINLFGLRKRAGRTKKSTAMFVSYNILANDVKFLSESGNWKMQIILPADEFK